MRNRNDFLEIEKELPFKQVPMLEIDGKKLVQTCKILFFFLKNAFSQKDTKNLSPLDLAAIVRYLASKYDLWGVGEDERYRVDCLYESIVDAKSKYYGIGFSQNSENHMENLVPELVEEYKNILKKVKKI